LDLAASTLEGVAIKARLAAYRLAQWSEGPKPLQQSSYLMGVVEAALAARQVVNQPAWSLLVAPGGGAPLPVRRARRRLRALRRDICDPRLDFYMPALPVLTFLLL
jgi:hypothetical protein